MTLPGALFRRKVDTRRTTEFGIAGAISNSALQAVAITATTEEPGGVAELLEKRCQAGQVFHSLSYNHWDPECTSTPHT